MGILLHINRSQLVSHFILNHAQHFYSSVVGNLDHHLFHQFFVGVYSHFIECDVRSHHSQSNHFHGLAKFAFWKLVIFLH